MVPFSDFQLALDLLGKNFDRKLNAISFSFTRINQRSCTLYGAQCRVIEWRDIAYNLARANFLSVRSCRRQSDFRNAAIRSAVVFFQRPVGTMMRPGGFLARCFT